MSYGVFDMIGELFEEAQTKKDVNCLKKQLLASIDNFATSRIEDIEEGD